MFSTRPFLMYHPLFIPDQDVNDSSIPSTKHHYVKQLLVEEVEKYTGAPIDMVNILPNYWYNRGN